MHKYQPVITVYKIDSGNGYVVCTYRPPEARFIAVTAYQNESIINLKVPEKHAKINMIIYKNICFVFY